MHFQKPMLGTPLDWGNPLNKGLVMHLGFQEGHGDVVRDLSMNGNHGTLKNMAFPSTPASGWNPGQTGVGLNFDGTSDYVDCGNDASVQLTGSLSVSAWFNPTVWQDGTSGYKPIVAKFNYGQKGWYLGRVWTNNDGIDFRLNHGDGTYDGIIFAGNIEEIKGTWIHAAGVFDAGNYVKLYINGVEWGSDDTVQGSFVDADTSFLQIGRRLSSSECFTGSIDQVRIHNRAMTAKEVQDYYINPWQVYLDEEDM